MGYFIVKQPNDLFALFSSIVDDFVIIDATKQDIINQFVEYYRQDTEERINQVIAALNGDKQHAYLLNYILSFDAAIQRIIEVHGSSAESLKMLHRNAV